MQVICPNMMGRTNDRKALIKRACVGLPAIVDQTRQVVLTCILRGVLLLFPDVILPFTSVKFFSI